MSKNSPIKTFAIQLLKAFVAALTVVLYSRWMGADGRGELGLLLFWVNILMILNEYVGGSSLGNILVKNPIENVVPFAKIWSIIVCVTGSVMLYYSGLTSNGILVLAMALPLAWLTIQYNIYQGLALVNRRNTVQLFLELSKSLLIVLVYWFLNIRNVHKEKIPLQWAVLTYTAAIVLALGLSFYFLRNFSSKFFRFNFRFPRELISTGFWSQNGQLVQFLNYRLALMLIDRKLGLAETGIYSNTLLIADTIWIFGNSFGTIAHMRMLRSENKKFRADITLRYASIAFAGTLISCGLLSLIPSTFFTFIFGNDFAALKSTVIWFIPSILVLGLSTVFSHYLHATNQFKVLLLANLAGLVVQVLSGIYLIPEFGLKGACLAANLGFFAILVVVLAVFKSQNPQAVFKGVFRLRAMQKIVLNMFR